MELQAPPLVVSGDSPQALAAEADRLREKVEATPDEALPDLGHRLLTTAHADHRGAVLATDRGGLLRGLTALAQGRPTRGVLTGTAGTARRPVLVFPGQGSVQPGMATELLASSPEFRDRVENYGRALSACLDGWDPAAALTAGEELIRLGTIQAVQFALSSALADSWRAHGLKEAAVVGHSVGEIAAAHACGALDTEDAARLLVLYGTALTSIEGRGAMASIAAPVDRIGPLIDRWSGRLGVAAVNSARNVTVSGDIDAVEELLAELTEQGIWAWKVPGIDVAGHSPQVDGLRELMAEEAPHAPSGPSRASFYSTATGTRLDDTGLTGDYWYRSMRGTVLFEQAVRALIDDGHRLFIEVSAHPTLTTVIGETLQAAGVTGAVVPTLDHRRSDRESFLQALTHAFVNGVPVSWETAYGRLVSRPRVTVTHTDAEPAEADAGRQRQTPGTEPAGLLDTTALRDASPDRQRETLVDLIATETGRVLGHGFATGTQTFLEIGFTSLGVVELIAALAAATGLDLPTTLVFDHPTPAALAEHLRHELGLAAEDPAAGGTDAPTRRAHRGPSDEPIAIVGIGCRYPGGVTDAESLWDLVAAGRDVIGEHPADRGWDTDDLYDPTPGELGKISSRNGGFLYDAADFDAGFFGLSPREATAMEPQQRLLLEVSWEAIEHAGIDPDTLRGTSTGVFAGVISQEYGPRLHQASDDVAGHAFMGTALCVASGRVAYTLGLEGPAITLDTACSSSLVAIHQACQALRDDDCELALAGGATVMSGPGVLVEFSRQRVLSPDGRCKAFSASADGIGLAEGVAVVVLERLSDARANGHPVLAVIRGSAVNQDGASNGLSAPSGSAQQRVIRHALANAGLTPQDIDVIEAHGTGTRLGDPIEAHALLATYGRERPEERPVLLGSVKSNIGHTQAAAGVAGLIKLVMALRHGQLPRSIHIDAPSPHINWSSGAVRLLTEQQDWPDADNRPRRAAVSSFGVSGTNSHLILEQAPHPADLADLSSERRADPSTEVMWTVSAKTGTALRAQAARLRRHLVDRPDLGPVDVAHALATTRSRFAHRAVAWGRSRDELLEALGALGDQRDHPGLVQGAVPASGPGKVVFVFPGQGSQWPGMGMELYDAYPVHRQALDRAAEALRPYTGWSVVDVLRGAPGAPALDRVDVVQPALFAVMTSLARLWQSFGVVPDAVVGHSQGEIAAAHIAGALTLPDAARLVALRAQALVELSGTGAMATVGLPADRAGELLAAYGGRIGVAAVNSPASTVVAGDTDAVTDLLRHCEAEGIRARRIDVDYASHSRHIDPLRDGLLERLADITPRPTTVAFHSTVDGHLQDGPLDGGSLDAAYWCANLRNTVRLTDTLRSLAGQGHRTFLECSPHPVLVPPIEETLDTTAFVTGTLHRAKPQTGTLTAARARLHAHGHTLDQNAGHSTAGHVDLPTYPFEHRRHWLTAAPTADVATAGQRTSEHPLLGAVIDLPDGEGLLLTGRVGLDTQPWLADHAATGVVLVPGTGYVDMALHAARLAGSPHIAELALHAPMVLTEQDALDLQLRIGPADEHGHRPLTLHARTHGTDDTAPPPWTLHATARLSEEPSGPPPEAGPSSWPPADADPIDLAALRAGLAAAGYDYGPAFGGLRTAWRQGEHFYAEVHLPEGLAATGHALHPALLDAALHPIAVPDTAADPAVGRTGPRLPFTFGGITHTGNATTRLRVHLRLVKPDTVAVTATDDNAPVLTVQALTLRATAGDHLRRLLRTGPEHDLLRLDWTASPTDSVGPGDTGTWALLDPDPEPAAVFGDLPRYADLSALTAAIDAGAAPPETVVWALPAPDPADMKDLPDAVRARCQEVLDLLQGWLAHDKLTRTVLAVVTRGAVATGPHDLPNLVHGPAWGLLHSAQNENPGRIVLIDTDHHPDTPAALSAVLAAGHPQSAVRGGQAYIPHLARTATAELLTPPADTPLWRLDTTGGGLDDLALLPAPEADAPLRPGQVRVDVRAAGVNFYDTAAALGLIAVQHDSGAEAAGVVTEAGPGVDLAVGDRVAVLTEKAFGPVAVADRRMVTRIADDWSFAEAASVPVAFVTAYHALVDLAGIRPGETVLIHAAAGGVGQAATQLARHLGAVPLATAHPDKWDTLRGLGYAEEHIANSRTLDFAERFRDVTGGRGVDVVLNALAGPFTDASLDLVAAGGRFIELGKTDIRDAGQLAATHPHLAYRAFDRRDSASPERTEEILAELHRLFDGGVLTPLPVTAYGIGRAADAFRLMRDARHTGKIVLTLPRPLDPDGTVLITGGTGTLGGLLARHLVTAHGARQLLLASRGGPDAAGADRLSAELTALGAQVRIAACDAADPDALRGLLDSIPSEHPLTGVFHTAGVLADGTVPNLTPDDLHRVFAPKVDAAWHLHERTRHLDLAAFVLYSSTASTLGNPGQGNYAAANTFLDALARHRRRQGLAATSVAWGWWQPVTGLTGALTDADNTRIARTGLAPITAEYGHALLDAALELPYAAVTATPLNQQTLRTNSTYGTLHPLLERLSAAVGTRRAATVSAPAPDLRADLADLGPDARLRRLQSLIGTHAAAVLGLDATTPLAPDQSFRDSGFDSLTALELRNRLTTATGLQLPATLTYDHPTPVSLAGHLDGELFPDSGDDGAQAPEDTRIQEAIAAIPLARLRELGLLDTLLQIAGIETAPGDDHDGIEDIRTASLDELVAKAFSAEDAE